MKRLFTTFALTLITQYASFATLPPAITLAPLITSSFCVGSSAIIGFTADTYPSGHIYAVQLSDSNGSFSGTPTVLGTGQSSPITFTLPSYSSGTTSNYRLRVIDQNDNSRVSASSVAIYFGTLSMKLQTIGGETSSTYICNGSSVKLYATTNFPDNSYFSYYWFKDNNLISVPTSDNTYTTNQPGVYRVRVQRYGCDGYFWSNYFNVSNTNNLSGENFTYGNNFSPYQCAGTTLAFKSVYEAENATYQWKKDGTIIGGETKSLLNITQPGSYTLTVNDANCTASSSYTLTKNLTFGNVINSLISSSPNGIINDSVSFCVNNQNVSLYHNNNLTNSSSYSYQWKKNGIDINGGNQYILNNLAAGIYSLKVTQGNCSAISKSIFVNSTNSSSKVIFPFYGTNACVGDNVQLAVGGLSCSSYQWQKDGIDIPQAIGTYHEATQTGSYRVKLFENGLTSYSNSINVNISDTQTYIISEGKTECFPVKPYYYSYFNSYPFDGRTFQWYKNDVPISGATNYDYNITSSGTYKLKVTKGSCMGFSQNQEVIIPPVNQLPIPPLSFYYGSVGCSGSYLTLWTNYFSNANYEWKRNGQTILNGLGIYQFDVSQAGNYTVTITQNTCAATTDTITVNIGNKQQSIKNSNWNDATMWSCGTVPTILEDVLINKGHTISIPNNYTGFVKDLQLNGVLQYGNNALLKSRTN
jgi:trimeric autotransporter adhesin